MKCDHKFAQPSVLPGSALHVCTLIAGFTLGSAALGAPIAQITEPGGIPAFRAPAPTQQPAMLPIPRLAIPSVLPSLVMTPMLVYRGSTLPDTVITQSLSYLGVAIPDRLVTATLSYVGVAIPARLTTQSLVYHGVPLEQGMIPAARFPVQPPPSMPLR